MKSKLEYLLQSENLTATSLARLLEIQPSGLSHILSGRNKPSFDLVVKILRAFPKINPDWLLLDSSQIYRDAIDDEVLVDSPTREVEDSRDSCHLRLTKISKSHSLKRSKKMKRV